MKTANRSRASKSRILKLQTASELDFDVPIVIVARPEYYMVSNDIGGRYGAGEQMLRIECLEIKIGQKRQPKEFSKAFTINQTQSWLDTPWRMRSHFTCDWRGLDR
jgi:hypothetical protein